MKQADIESGVLEVFESVLGHPVNTSLTRAEAPGWDSLKHMQIVFAVEDKFSVQFLEEDIPRMDSIQWLVEYLERHNAS
jgi:acyl carrier protein